MLLYLFRLMENHEMNLFCLLISIEKFHVCERSSSTFPLCNQALFQGHSDSNGEAMAEVCA